MAHEFEKALLQKKMNEALGKVINEVEGGGIFTLFALSDFSQTLVSCSDEELARRFPRDDNAGRFYRDLAIRILPLVDQVFGMNPGVPN